ncbi:MAG: hypothetical protein WCR83_05345 [Candidatus Methanomethylophilaceae archaeon]
MKQGSLDPQHDESLLKIEVPRAGFTDDKLENLKAIVKAKAHLLSKALGKKPLPLIITEDKVSFPWFSSDATPEENKAYMLLVSRLCILDRKVKRVSMQESRDVGNDKYAFRCFLLRLGFIGDEYKNTRKILLKNLSGRSAFKEGKSERSEQ